MRPNAIKRAAGPPVASAAPEETNNPVPIGMNQYSLSNRLRCLMLTDGSSNGNHLQVTSFELAGEGRRGGARVDILNVKGAGAPATGDWLDRIPVWTGPEAVYKATHGALMLLHGADVIVGEARVW